MDGQLFQYQRKPHPRANANFLSVLTFSWMIPVFYKGVKRTVDAEDLYEPLPDNKSRKQGELIERAWENEVRCSRSRGRRPSYLRALWAVYGSQLVRQGALVFVLEFAVRLSQPFFLGGLIEAVTSDDRTDCYTCAGGLVASTLLAALIMHSYHMGIILVGMNMRVATCSLIYRKVLAAKRAGKTLKGRVVNLMTNDALRFDFAVTCLHDLWVAPVQILVVSYLMYRILGWSALVGMAAMFSCAPLQVWLGKKTSSLRQQTALKSDARIGLMGEIVHGIQLVKTHAWEYHVKKLIKNARIEEMSVIKRMAAVRGVMTSFQMYHARSAAALTILTYVLLGYTLTAYKVFMMTSFFGVLGTTVGVFFPTGILLVSECYTSVKRVEEFLIEQLPDPNVPTSKDEADHEEPTSLISPTEEKGLIVNNVTSRWSADQQEPVLADVTLRAVPGQLTVILGGVGSGKTSLLQTIIGELVVTRGSVVAPAALAYASQEPWLFPGSIRQNILFGEDFKEDHYSRVVQKCALNVDFDSLEYRDSSRVGEQGVTLSGGQKARVNLARAIYKEADLYLLDDPIAAVDNVVRGHLMTQCIRPLSRTKTVVLVTHSLDYLSPDDNVVYLEKGRIVHIRVDELNMWNKTPARDIHQDELQKQSQTEISPTRADHQEVKIKKRSALSAYLSACGWTSIFVGILFVASQIFGSASDYWVSIWVSLEENSYNSTDPTDLIVDALSVDINRQFCLWVFGALIVGTCFFSLVRSFAYFLTSARASKKLHKSMFSSVLSAKMPFFYTTKSGSIMSRFSKDQGTVDEHLPVTMMDFLQIGFSVIGILIVVPSTKAWLVIPTIVVLAAFYFMRIIYVRTTKGLREIEGQARSPLLTHVGNTIDGLTTIHSRRAEGMVAAQFDSLQDFHTSAWYLYLAANRSFAFWLDICCVLYNAAVTFSFLVVSGAVQAADVGLAITQCSGLANTMEWGLRQSAEVENSLVSVNRIAEYTNLETEAPFQSKKGLTVIDGWPRRGAIEFTDVYMRYGELSPWVLKGVTFSVTPRQKVGIVGRTGSGKSSLASALFRLVDFEGTIKIDGVETRLLGLHDLRPKMTIIPQEPVLFTGTIRSNLDPLGEYDDAQIWDALDKVEMTDFARGRGLGLSAEVSERGSNLSAGEKQLLSLARGLLRSNRIVLFDEATARVDRKTEEIIQRTIRTHLEATTVITIAHRLDTVMNSDVIIVIDSGQVKQIGSPSDLLSDTNGAFYALATETENFGRPSSPNTNTQ